MTARIATDELVSATADALLAEGIQPTLKLLQERTGGSYTTVNKAFGRWKEQRALDQQLEDPPTEVAHKGDQLLRVVWAAAKRIAETRVEEIRQAAELSVQSIRSELQHAQEQIGHLEGSLAVLTSRYEDTRLALENEQSRAQAETGRLQHLAAEYNRCANALEQSRADSGQSLIRAATLDGECAALKAQIAELRTLVHPSVQSKEPDRSKG